ncbi:hypothetical protein ACFO6V_02305 [Promicromonospora alba]|uniref:Uncharacterized protein n=1 Tax=Promicromonospora alba TaxID=1616110 RepID=A0ABV9HCH1_9MICO
MGSEHVVSTLEDAGLYRRQVINRRILRHAEEDGMSFNLLSRFLPYMLVATLLGGCAFRTVEDVPAPEFWEMEYEDGIGSRIELSDDGSGRLINVPEGLFADCVGNPDEHGPSGSFDPLWSGEVEWRNSGEGQAVVESELGQATIWSDASGFGGDLTWSQISVAICDPEKDEQRVLRYFSFPDTSPEPSS